tara:strand:- start:48 stop:653 length:606 start_codon:yes stop_codon:yes gene_type:complete
MGLLGQDFVSRITGSAFADTAANTITAPQGQAIIGIQVIGDATNVVLFDSLVAVDATRDFNTVSAAGSTGRFTRKVNVAGGISSATSAIFDEENYQAADGGIKPGDKIFNAAGTQLAVVLALNPNSNNTKEISTVAAFSASDNEVLTFVRDEEFTNVGTGGQAFANSNKLLSGTTIYGTWESVSLNTDDTDGGIIAYFGQI